MAYILRTFVVIVTLGVGGFANATLLIDFSGRDGTDPLQSGFAGWAGPEVGNPGSNYNETRTFASTAGVAGSLDLTVRSDGLFFRDYDPITTGLRDHSVG
jgi:hypothetical protein